METFDRLPAYSKYIHLASLSFIALSVTLLMMPATYHRIVERGEDTKRFQQFAGRTLLVEVVPLALSISGDFFVLVSRVTHAVGRAAALAAAMLALFYVLWFAVPLHRRRTEA